MKRSKNDRKEMTMSDISNQTPDEERLSSMSVAELKAVQQSWLREKEKASKEVRACDDVLVMVHMELNRKGAFSEQYSDILKNMKEGDSDG